LVANASRSDSNERTSYIARIALDTGAVLTQTLAPRMSLSTPSRRLWSIVAVATVLLAGGGYLLYRSFANAPAPEPRGVAALVAAVGNRRPVEARMTGGFAHGPYSPAARRRGPSPRAEGARPHDSESLHLIRARADILTELVEHASPAAFGACALLDLATGDTEKAVRGLEEATAEAPANARLLNDLAVAYLARGEDEDQPRDLVRALSTIDRAVAADNSLPEARFNRALMLERVYLYPAAREAWREYLALEESSGWAAEARDHLAKLEAPGEDALWAAARGELDEVVARGDLAAAREVVGRHPNSARTYARDELFAAWADARAEGRGEDAARALETARTVGVALAELQRDTFVRDAVASADVAARAPDSERRLEALARGHRAYRDGLTLIASEEYERAASAFDEAHRAFAYVVVTPYRALTAYQRAICTAYRFNYASALATVEQVRDISEQRGYLHLAGLCWILLSQVQNSRFEPARAVSSGLAALPYLEANGDTNKLSLAHAALADSYKYLGNLDAMAKHQYQALASLRRAGGVPSLLPTMLAVSAEKLGILGEYTIALYFLDSALAEVSRDSTESDRGYLFFERSCTNARLGRRAEADADLERATRHCDAISDKSVRSGLKAVILIEGGERLIESDPAGAVESLTAADKVYENTTDRSFAAKIHLLRGRAYLRLGDDDRAERDLQGAIDEFERTRHTIPQEGLRISFFQESQSAYEEMIAFQLARRDRPDRAFDYAETARARALLDILEKNRRAASVDSRIVLSLDEQARPLRLNVIQSSLPEGVALVEYSVLPDRLQVWVVRRDAVDALSSPVRGEEVERMADDFRRAVEAGVAGDGLKWASAPLYNAAVRVLEPFLSPGVAVIVVPDKGLQQVPFAALLNPDTGQYLIEDRPLVVCPSASIFVRCLQRDRVLQAHDDGSALVVGNPRFDRNSFPGLADLPGAAAEATRIATLYRPSALLQGEAATKSAFLAAAGRYSVVHFAGHALMDADSPLNSRLIFAPEPGATAGNGGGALSAYELYRERFARTRLVVLAACRTAGGQSMPGEGMASLARPFLAAGVPAVMAALWDADDYAAERLVTAFSERRSAGDDPMTALRVAQLGLLRGADGSLRSPAMWANFQLLGGVVPAQPQ
jgi:CHAT domain-containing protein